MIKGKQVHTASAAGSQNAGSAEAHTSAEESFDWDMYDGKVLRWLDRVFVSLTACPLADASESSGTCCCLHSVCCAYLNKKAHRHLMLAAGGLRPRLLLCAHQRQRPRPAPSASDLKPTASPPRWTMNRLKRQRSVRHLRSGLSRWFAKWSTSHWWRQHQWSVRPISMRHPVAAMLLLSVKSRRVTDPMCLLFRLVTRLSVLTTTTAWRHRL